MRFGATPNQRAKYVTIALKNEATSYFGEISPAITHNSDEAMAACTAARPSTPLGRMGIIRTYFGTSMASNAPNRPEFKSDVRVGF